MNECVDEVKLISNILQKLADTSESNPIRKDHLEPLVARLQKVCVIIESNVAATNATSSPAPLLKNSDKETIRSKNATAVKNSGVKITPKTTRNSTKTSSLIARPVEREKPPNNGVVISKEITRVFAAVLYNVLESVTRLTGSKSAHIFVRAEDEMLSIANVSTNLSFPPHLTHHPCLGSIDRDVLSSKIALNRRINKGAHGSAVPLLIFPIFPKRSLQQACPQSIAVLHLEKPRNGRFDEIDEHFCYHATCLIGELMSRVPEFEWVNHFYDPVTQHIVAPFSTEQSSSLPALVSGRSKEADMLERVEATPPDVLIRRDALPTSSTKSSIQGLSATPTLREVSVYLENMQDSWKKGISSSVGMTEEERSMSTEMKVLRHQLRHAQNELASANEKLRLYELSTEDYKGEYQNLRKELENYMTEREER